MGRRILTGRYVPDDRVLTHEPAGVYEDPVAPGVAELRVEPLSVMCITPRPVRRRKHSMIRKALVLLSVIALPVAFVACADALASSPRLFFGSLGICFGWPMFVVWANYRD